MKKVLAAALCLCLLFCAFVVPTSAANIVVDEIVSEIRICPGKVLDKALDAPGVAGVVYSEGWEILSADGVWIPYDGSPLEEGEMYIKYFAADPANEYEYSNVCHVIVDHNPQGGYEYDGMYHWRDCADCGGQAVKDAHTTLDHGYTPNDTICQVCGQTRTSQYTGIKAFIAWIMSLITMLLA